MKVKFNSEEMAKFKKILTAINTGAELTLTRAINTSVKTILTQARVRIGNELNLKASRISKNLSFKNASFGNLSGAVIGKGRPVGLVSYGAKRYGSGKRGKGIQVKVLRSGGSSKLKHAFITTGKRGQALSTDGNKHVFFRQIKGGRKVSRYPLETLHGPRTTDIFASDKVLEPLTIQAAHIFAANVDKGILTIFRRTN
jgi:hypothetical protein